VVFVRITVHELEFVEVTEVLGLASGLEVEDTDPALVGGG
jgi:hypothetical protein